MNESPTRRRSPLFVFAAAVIALWGLHAAEEFLVPVMVAALLSFLMAPATRAMRRLRVPEPIAVFLSALLLVFPLAGFLFLMVSEIQSLINHWPELSASLLRSLSEFRQSGLAARLHLAGPLNPEQLQSKLQEGLGSGLKMALLSLKTILDATTLLLLMIFFSVALLASRVHLKKSFDQLLSAYTDIEAGPTVARMAQMMETYLVARTVIAFGLAAGSFAILLAFGIPYAFVLCAFLGLMTWVPVIGFFVGIGPVLALGFGSGAGGGKMLAIFLALGTIWLIQDHIITPKWVGHKVKLNFLVTYLAFFAGGMLWGAWGMILSIPLVGVVRIACRASPGLRPWAFLLGEDDGHPAPAQVRVEKYSAPR